MTEDCTTRCCDLDGSIGGWRNYTLVLSLPVDYTELTSDQVDSENVVCIGEETNTCDNDSSHMVPAERCLVDFSERKSSSLVGILDVGEVVVEVVERSVAAACLSGHF